MRFFRHDRFLLGPLGAHLQADPGVTGGGPGPWAAMQKKKKKRVSPSDAIPAPRSRALRPAPTRVLQGARTPSSKLIAVRTPLVGKTAELGAGSSRTREIHGAGRQAGDPRLALYSWTNSPTISAGPEPVRRRNSVCSDGSTAAGTPQASVHWPPVWVLASESPGRSAGKPATSAQRRPHQVVGGRAATGCAGRPAPRHRASRPSPISTSQRRPLNRARPPAAQAQSAVRRQPRRPRAGGRDPGPVFDLVGSRSRGGLRHPENRSARAPSRPPNPHLQPAAQARPSPFSLLAGEPACVAFAATAGEPADRGRVGFGRGLPAVAATGAEAGALFDGP